MLKVKDLLHHETAGVVFSLLTTFNLIETKRHLSDRFGEHRRIIEKSIQRRHINQPTAVSDHFSLPGHSINNIELIPLELIKSNRDGIRKAREALLISKGKTLEPHGINRRDET